MREIRLTWDLGTDVLTVDSFERISRGVSYHLRLFVVRFGAAEMLPVGSVILALAKMSPGGEIIMGCNDWTLPARLSDPYTGTLAVGGEPLDGLFADIDGEHAEVGLLFQITHRPDLGSAPGNSELVPLVVINDLERDDDVMPVGPVENPFALADMRYVRHDGAQGLSGAGKARARGNIGMVESLIVALGDQSTDIETGLKVTFRMPYDFTLTGTLWSLVEAATGAAFIGDIKVAGTSVFSTKPSIDAGATTSATATAPEVIDDGVIAYGEEITIFIEQIGALTAGKGPVVSLIGKQT